MYSTFDNYKNKIKSAPDFDNAMIILNDALSKTNDETERILLKSLVSEYNYNDEVDFNKFVEYLDIVGLLYYNDDVQQIIDDVDEWTIAQLDTLKRIAQSKVSRCVKNVKYGFCPHCGRKNNTIIDGIYGVCGFSPKGYKWTGCGKDWCAKCSKKLCKQWAADKLFNKYNRYHSGKCCKKYAESVGENYEDNYCQCHDVFFKMNHES